MSALDALLAHSPWLWRGVRCPARPGLHTGFSALDAVLPQQAWPADALIDMTVSEWGLGEVRLLLPVMKQLMARRQRVVWIAPPYLPHAVALCQHGVPLPLLTVVTPDDAKGTLWSMEKCLRAAACGLAVAWLDAKVPDSALRRLQLTAFEHHKPAFLLRRAARPPRTTPAALCLHIDRPAGPLQLAVVKARGGNRPHRVTVCL